MRQDVARTADIATDIQSIGRGERADPHAAECIECQPIGSGSFIANAQAAGGRVVAVTGNAKVTSGSSGVIQVNGWRIARNSAVDLHAFTMSSCDVEVQ